MPLYIYVYIRRSACAQIPASSGRSRSAVLRVVRTQWPWAYKKTHGHTREYVYILLHPGKSAGPAGSTFSNSIHLRDTPRVTVTRNIETDRVT